MRTKKRKAYKRPSAAKIDKALKSLDAKGYAFYGARYAFALLVYDAGNKSEASFCAAAKAILLEWYGKTGSPWGFHENTYKSLFRQIEQHESTQS